MTRAVALAAAAVVLGIVAIIDATRDEPVVKPINIPPPLEGRPLPDLSAYDLRKAREANLQRYGREEYARGYRDGARGRKASPNRP